MHVLVHVQDLNMSLKIHIFCVSVCDCVTVGAGGYSGRLDGAVIG